MDRAAAIRLAYERFIATGRLADDVYTDDFVWDMSTFAGWPEKPQYPGVDGAREFLDEWIASWADWKLEVRDVIEAPSGEVVVILHQSGRTKESGLQVDMDFASVWTLREGKFARQRMYADVSEALAAAGAERRAEPRGT